MRPDAGASGRGFERRYNWGMLKNVSPLLTPDLLWCLAAMGHGDDVAVVDANFPARAVASRTTFGRPVEISGGDVPETLAAILALLPLDTFVPEPVLRMQVVGQPDEIPPAQADAIAVLRNSHPSHSHPTPSDSSDSGAKVGSLERFAFYEAAKQSFAVVQARGESRPYGCLLLKKGVILADS